MARLPGYRLVLPETGLVGIVIFYLLLFIIYRRVYKGRKHDFSIKAAYMVIAGIVLSVIVNFGMKMDKLEINFVNVDQGDGAVLSIPFRETVIIDGGGTGPVNDYDFGKNVFLPYLKSNGHNVIDVAVVSHFHEDHCMGVIAAMEELKVRDVVISDTLPENENRRKIEMLAEEKGINLVYCKAGMRLKFESGMIMEFIAPDERDLRLQDENNTSFGIKVAYGDFSAIFTGDMSGEVENFHKGEWGDCDLIKVGHHGSKTSTTEEFIAETTPEVAVISLGKNNSYGFPKESVLSTLSKYGVSVFRTDINGDISVFADKNGKYSVKAFRVGDKPQ